jgi:hypothetical protein
MCLYSRAFLPRRTKTVMTVYKVVRIRKKSKKGRQSLFSPVTRTPIYLNNKITANGPKRARLTEWRYLVPGFSWLFNTGTPYTVRCFMPRSYSLQQETDIVYTVDAGYIHCCPDFISAYEWTKRNSGLFPHRRWAIVKCIVPCGTLYFENYDKTQICVRTLIPRKIVSHG